MFEKKVTQKQLIEIMKSFNKEIVFYNYIKKIGIYVMNFGKIFITKDELMKFEEKIDALYKELGFKYIPAKEIWQKAQVIRIKKKK